MRALLIDPEAMSVTELDYSGNWDDARKLIGCETIEVVRDGTRELLCDDDGSFKEHLHLFHFQKQDAYWQPIFGKAIATSWKHDKEAGIVSSNLDKSIINILWQEQEL